MDWQFEQNQIPFLSQWDCAPTEREDGKVFRSVQEMYVENQLPQRSRSSKVLPKKLSIVALSGSSSSTIATTATSSSRIATTTIPTSSSTNNNRMKIPTPSPCLNSSQQPQQNYFFKKPVVSSQEQQQSSNSVSRSMSNLPKQSTVVSCQSSLRNSKPPLMTNRENKENIDPTQLNNNCSKLQNSTLEAEQIHKQKQSYEQNQLNHLNSMQNSQMKQQLEITNEKLLAMQRQKDAQIAKNNELQSNYDSLLKEFRLMQMQIRFETSISQIEVLLTEKEKELAEKSKALKEVEYSLEQQRQQQYQHHHLQQQQQISEQMHQSCERCQSMLTRYEVEKTTHMMLVDELRMEQASILAQKCAAELQVATMQGKILELQAEIDKQSAMKLHVIEWENVLKEKTAVLMQLQEVESENSQRICEVKERELEDKEYVLLSREQRLKEREERLMFECNRVNEEKQRVRSNILALNTASFTSNHAKFEERSPFKEIQLRDLTLEREGFDGRNVKPLLQEDLEKHSKEATFCGKSEEGVSLKNQYFGGQNTSEQKEQQQFLGVKNVSDGGVDRNRFRVFKQSHQIQSQRSYNSNSFQYRTPAEKQIVEYNSSICCSSSGSHINNNHENSSKSNIANGSSNSLSKWQQQQQEEEQQQQQGLESIGKAQEELEMQREALRMNEEIFEKKITLQQQQLNRRKESLDRKESELAKRERNLCSSNVNQHSFVSGGSPSVRISTYSTRVGGETSSSASAGQFRSISSNK